MSNFVELTDSGGNKFITPKSSIGVVFIGGLNLDEDEDAVWEGEPCVVAIIDNAPTKLENTYEEMATLLL